MASSGGLVAETRGPRVVPFPSTLRSPVSPAGVPERVWGDRRRGEVAVSLAPVWRLRLERAGRRGRPGIEETSTRLVE